VGVVAWIFWINGGLIEVYGAHFTRVLSTLPTWHPAQSGEGTIHHAWSGVKRMRRGKRGRCDFEILYYCKRVLRYEPRRASIFQGVP
jgi:hypothetical protein